MYYLTNIIHFFTGFISSFNPYICLSKQYLDESRDKGIIEKLYDLFYSLITLLFSMMLILF
jgi:hypothetical protein